MANINWSLNEAWAAEEVYLLENNGKSSPCSPFQQWHGLNELEHKRKFVEAGDGFEVLACIRICVTRGLIAPEWLAYAFNRRYDAVLTCKAKSWDDDASFGKPYKKGFNLRAARKKRKLMFAVWNEANHILKSNPETPIDEALFECIGKKFYIGKTLASEYYYDAKKRLSR